MPLQMPGSRASLITLLFSISMMACSGISKAFDTTVNSQVFAMAEQTDGKFIVAGSFTFIIGPEEAPTASSGIARLHADGTVDESFNVGTGANGSIISIALQPDGKVLIAGSFTQFNGIPRARIARLNSDGSVDASFPGGSGFDGDVFAIALQPDGKIVAVGNFDLVRGNTLNNIARLNADSTVDQSFDPGEGANAIVRSVDIEADGQIIIGGDFTRVNSLTRAYVARLNTNGSLDTGLISIFGPNALVRRVAAQADGKILIAGDFTLVGGSRRNRIARLNPNGSADSGFATGSGANGLISAMALQPDGKIVIGGNFSLLRGNVRNRLARLNSDSAVDLSFDVGAGPDDIVSTILPLSSGKILIGGFFANIGNINKPHLARVLANGRLDTGEAEDFCIPVKAANGNLAVICLGE